MKLRLTRSPPTPEDLLISVAYVGRGSPRLAVALQNPEYERRDADLMYQGMLHDAVYLWGPSYPGEVGPEFPEETGHAWYLRVT